MDSNCRRGGGGRGARINWGVDTLIQVHSLGGGRNSFGGQRHLRFGIDRGEVVKKEGVYGINVLPLKVVYN